MTAKEWNATHPVGTPIRCWPILPAHVDTPPIDSRTRTEAWALGHGAAVVSIEGKTGGVLLSHIEVREP